MDDQDLVCLCTVQSPTEAEIIRAALQGAGIACQLGGEGQAGLVGFMAIEVLTRASETKKARKLLRQVRAEQVERKKKRVAAKRAASEAIQEVKPSTGIKRPSK